MTTFAGAPAQNTIIATRNVTFIDGYDNSNISEQTIEVGKDANIPSDPSHDGLVFAGWYLYDDQDVRVEDFTNILNDLRVVAKYAGDINRNGVADDNEERYTVQFVDTFNNRVLSTQEVLPGMSATAPNVPNHPGVTFAGWATGYENVTGNTTINTVYTQVNEEPTPVFYQVTFMDGFDNSVIATVAVGEGLTATAPQAPTHAGKVFDGWQGSYSNVTGDGTVTATYADDLNNDGIADYLQEHYTVTFVAGEHGSIEGTTIYTNIVKGLTFEQVGIKVPKTIPANELYKFANWTPEMKRTVNENAVYTANFTPVGEDKNNNGVADEEETHTLTVQHITINKNTNAENILGSDSKSLLEGDSFTATAEEFKGYTLASEEVISGVMGKEDITVKFVYVPTMEDKNGNGIADEHYLTVKYMSGSNELGTEDAVIYSEGETYEVTAKEFEGYTLTSDETITGTMGNKDITVTFNYKTTIEDKNNNGIADEHYLIIKSVSGKNELSKDTRILSKGDTYSIKAEKFTGYKLVSEEVVSGTMQDEDITVTFNYETEIPDKNKDGIANEHYLTVKYMSGTNELGTEDAVIYSEGETYEVTAKEFEGYTLTSDETITGTMGTEDITVTFNYKTTIEDKNGNDIADEHYLTVKHVSGKTELETEEAVIYSEGETYTVNAKEFDGYAVDGDQEITGTMGNKDVTVTFNYKDIKPVITDIKNDHGKNKIWTNAANVKDKTVKVTVEGKAAKGRTIVGYSINGIEGLFQESPEFTFTENQTINVAVIDNKGIVSEVETYEITNFDVDNNKPVFNPKTEENPVFNGEGGVAKKVNFNVVDKESGLRYVTSLSGKYATADAFEKAVKDEKHTVDEMPQITVAEDGTATITALKNGFYTIYAEDWAGNKEVLVFEVTGIEEVKDTDDKVINETHYGVNYKIGKTQYEDKAWFLIYWKRYQPYRTVELKAENGTEILAAYWSKEASNTPDEFFSKSYEKAYEMPVDATTGTNNVNFTMKGSKYTTIYTIYVKSRNKTTGEIEEYVMPVKASAYFIFWEMNN